MTATRCCLLCLQFCYAFFCKKVVKNSIAINVVMIARTTVLDEDWYHSEDPVTSGVSFFVKVSLALWAVVLVVTNVL